MKKLFAILMSIMMIACFMPTMAFATISAENITLTGKLANGPGNGQEITSESSPINFGVSAYGYTENADTLTVTITNNSTTDATGDLTVTVTNKDDASSASSYFTLGEGKKDSITVETIAKKEENAEASSATFTVKPAADLAVKETDYVSTIKIKSGEIELKSFDVKIKVSKQFVTVPTAVAETLTYDGTAKTGVTQTPADESIYTLSGNTATDAGSHEAMATLKNTDNYAWNLGEDVEASSEPQKIPWSIAKATPEATHFDFTPGQTFAYDAGTHTVKPTLITKFEKSGDITYSYEKIVGGTAKTVDGEPTDVGTYKVTVHVAGGDRMNFEKGDVTADNWTFQITEGQTSTTPPAAKSGLTYSGRDQELITKGTLPTGCGCTVKYKVDKVDTEGATIVAGEWQTEVPKAAQAGNYKVSYMVTGCGNHASVSETVVGTVTIAKKALSVTANSKNITYGDEVPEFDGNIDGFVEGEDATYLNGEPVYTCAYAQFGDVNTYDITSSGLTSDNYAITFNNGTLTVAQKEVGLQWAGYEKLRFGDDVDVTATATGTVNNDKIGVNVSGGTVGTVGDHEATATGLTGDKANNYKLPTEAKQAYSVAKAIAGKVQPQYVLLAAKDTSEQTVDLSDFIPVNAANLSYQIDTDGGLIDKSGESNKVDDNKAYKFKLATDAAATAQTVTITIKSANYEDITVVINVETTADKIPTVTVTPITHTYDGEALNKSLITGTAVYGTDHPVDVAGTFDWTDGAPTNVADSGKYNVTFTPSEAGYATVKTVVDVTINKADHENVTDKETAKQGEAYQLDFVKKFNLQNFSYGEPQVDTGNDLFAVGPKFDGKTGHLTFQFEGNATVGETAAITVQVNESANYNAFTITIKVTVAQKSSDSSSGGSYYPYTPSTPSTPAAPNLDKTKTDSTTALNAAATANKYDAAEQAEVKKILDKANADIKNAKTEAEVKAIEEAAQAEIDKILTTEEKAIVAALDNVEKRDFATKSKVITRKSGKKVIRLTWTAPDGVDVDGYEIFRSTKKNSGFGKKPYFTTSNTSYTNTKNLKTGKTYYYKVRAFVVINGERVYTDYSLKANRKL